MANCSELSSTLPEVTLKPLIDDIRDEQMVGCNILLQDHARLSEFNSEYSNASVQKDSISDAFKQHTSNVHTLPSQILESVSLPSECTYIASNCDYFVAPKAESQDPISFAEQEDIQKIMNIDLEQSLQYVHSDKENASCYNESVEIKDTSHYQMICNGNADNSKCKAARNITNSAISEGSNIEKSVLREEILNTDSTLSDTSSTTETRDSEDFVQAKEGGNKTFKPAELTNQLIEGPCIMLPPSQLPVISSYSFPGSSNQRQSASSTSSMLEMAGLQHNTSNLNCVQTLMQDTHSSSSKIVQINSVNTVQQDAAENVSQQTLGAADRENIGSVAVPATSTLSATEAKSKAKRTPNDFVFGKVIGEGSYSTVYLAKEVSTQREFAIKVCDKKHLIRERKTHFVMREKEVLMKLDHPFFIKLAYTFQDSERLYYVLTYARNGELLSYLHKLSAFDVPCTRFYSAEIVLALEYLHGIGIIHRDLKPENILISEDMHIRITDFGTSKILSLDSNAKPENQVEVKRKNSFVGTAEYVSPEVLNNQPANFGSDLWALGCIIYQCLSGSLPFRSGNEYQTFQKIVKTEYDFPEGFHPDAKDLVRKLLVFDPSARLGMAKPEGMKALKKHSFYEGIDWETLPEATPPKLMPYLPATANNPEFWGQEQRTGFDDQRLAEIITGQGTDGSMSPELEEVPVKMMSQVEDTERAEKLRKQKLENQFHQFVQDNLIIKQGFVDKRKGLFARKRMLLLTEGPHLYYVDAHNKVLKGEIPWSKYLRPEAKNFKIFFVHTPNRTYYLESRQPDAQDWVKQIKDVWTKYYDNGKDKCVKISKLK